MFSKELKPEEWLPYDIVLLFFGKLASSEEIAMTERVFFVTNCHHLTIKKYLDWMTQLEIPNTIIFKGIIDSKLNADYFIQHLAGTVDYSFHFFEIKLKSKDQGYLIRMQYHFYQDFNHLSRNYIRILQEIAILITGKSRQLVIKACRYAKQGKWVKES